MSARSGLVLCTLTLVSLTSGATAFVVLSSTATVVNPDLGLSPRLPKAGLPPAGGGVVLLGNVPVSGSTDAAGRTPAARTPSDRPMTVLRGPSLPLAFPSAFAGLPVVALSLAPDAAALVVAPPVPDGPSDPAQPTAGPEVPSGPTAPAAPADPDGADPSPDAPVVDPRGGPTDPPDGAPSDGQDDADQREAERRARATQREQEKAQREQEKAQRDARRRPTAQLAAAEPGQADRTSDASPSNGGTADEPAADRGRSAKSARRVEKSG